MKQLFMLLITALFIGCADNIENIGQEASGDLHTKSVSGSDVVEVSHMKVSPEGRKYIEVDGVPFLMLGTQLRTDYFMQLENKQLSDLDRYFQLAKSMNVTVVQVPISWRDIESEKNQYKSEVVNQMIEYCDRYDLKLEILWFGSYMCGYSVRGYIPDYVVDNENDYPVLNPQASFEGWLGKQYFLAPNTPLLVERESKALAYMMDAIWEYDRSHGNKRTVIGIQVENEADMLATRHNSAHGYQPGDVWGNLMSMIDTLGKVVKNSKYRCYTRTNFTITYDDYIARCAQLINLGGIDFVGLDPYVNDVNALNNMLDQLGNINGNFAHFAENGGEFANNDILTLNALVKGMGYDIFEAVTTAHPFLQDWTLRGVFNPDFSHKPYTQRILDAYKIYQNAWYDFAIARLGNMVGFNIKENELRQTASEEVITQNIRIRWQTSQSGIAYAIENNGYLIISSTKADNMQFEAFNGVVLGEKAEVGYYGVNGTWVVESEQNINSNSLTLEPTKTYRIKATRPAIWVSSTYITTTHSAKDITVSVESNINWTASLNSEASSWCTLNQTVENGIGSLTLHINDLSTADIREALITIRSGEQSRTISLQQGWGVEINGLFWAHYNVAEANYFTASIDARGLLYQYDSRIGYPNSSPNTSDAPYGYRTGWFELEETWAPGNNPCPAGWRIPTKTEIEGLLANGYTWVESGQNNFTIPGAIVGIPTSEARQATKENTRGGIFIPQTGFRRNEDGKQENWWEACITSITRPGQNWDRYTYLIDYTNTLYINEYTPNARAFPIRCVKNIN